MKPSQLMDEVFLQILEVNVAYVGAIFTSAAITRTGNSTSESFVISHDGDFAGKTITVKIQTSDEVAGTYVDAPTNTYHPNTTKGGHTSSINVLYYGSKPYMKLIIEAIAGGVVSQKLVVQRAVDSKKGTHAGAVIT